jgi:hypothetical protein
VAGRAAIGKSGANAADRTNVSAAIASVRTLALSTGVLALEQLASAADGAEGVALDNE